MSSTFFLSFCAILVSALADVIPKHFLSILKGHWSYSEPKGNDKFGQYIYSSPMGKACNSTLTVHMSGASCTVSGGSVTQQYIDDKLCIPLSLEVPASIIDILNSIPGQLLNTCLQISAHHYATELIMEESIGMFASDLVESTRKLPIKHAFLHYDRDKDVGMTAASLRLLSLNVGDASGTNMDFPENSPHYTSFHVKASQSVVLPGILKRLLPSKFAVIYDDVSASSFGKALRDAAAAYGRQIPLEMVVPYAGPVKLWNEMMRTFLDDVLRKQLRYIFIYSDHKAFPAVLLCAAYRAGLSDYVQIVSIVSPSLLKWVWSTSTVCPLEVRDVAGENTGFTGVYAPYASDAATDLSINLASGSPGRTEPGDFNVFGPWISNSFNVTNTSTCADSADINNSVMLRRLFKKKAGEDLLCPEAVVVGQTEVFGWIRDIAKYCPVASCLYNSESEPCRISCACTNSSLVHPLGGPWCTSVESLPFTLGQYKPRRCSGSGCRPVMTGHNFAESFGNLHLPWGYAGGYCNGPNYTCPRGAFYDIYVFGYPYSDGLWSMAMAYRCIETRHGEAGLSRLVNHDYMDDWLIKELVSCMETEVKFQGFAGDLDYKHYHGPSPGQTLYLVGQYFAAGNDYWTGFFQDDDLLLTHRTIWRRNSSECTAMQIVLAPGLICPNGSSLEWRIEWGNDADIPLGSPSICPPGEYPLPFGESIMPAHTDVFRCGPCAAGTFKSSQGDGLCNPCPPGMSSGVGATSCTICGKNMRSADVPVRRKLLQDGRYVEFGATSCISCLNGEVSMPGASRCDACDPGMFGPSSTEHLNSSHPDPVGCLLCPLGTFQPEASKTECVSCDTVLLGSSSIRGAKSSTECGCPEGKFYKPGEGEAQDICESCPEGMQCPGLLAKPLQLPGFWAEETDPVLRKYAVKRCRNKLECPGGAEAGKEGSCAAGRTDVACNNCKPNHHKADYGECHACGAGNVLPMVATITVVPAGILIAMLFVRVDFAKQQLTSLTVVITGGQLVGALQALTAIRSLSIRWEDPVKSFLNALSVLALDIDILQVNCISQSDDPLVKYVAQLLGFPVLSLAVVVCWLICKLTGRPVMVDTIVNLIGAALMMLYISITIMVLTPFQCVPNPDQTYSMSSMPGIVCWTTVLHQVMIALSVLGILCYPITLLAWAGWTIYTYPKRIQAGAGMALVRRYRFLFQRFKAEVYYYGIILLTRNTLIAVVPVLFVGLSVIQVMVMGAVLQLGAAIQTRLWPWRTEPSNIADMVIAMTLVVLLLAAAPLLDVPEQMKVEALGGILLVLVLISFICAAIVVAHAIFRRFRPPELFGMFLCHHKAGAGALARYVKMRSHAYTKAQIFLDSDNLDELDLIFDVIRTQTKNLVVMLSPELLTRMWCAGEIATAFANKVPFVPIDCDSYQRPDDETIENIPDLWTAEQKHTLGNLAVTVDLIKEAYRKLRDVPLLKMPRFGNATEKEDGIIRLLSTCRLGNFKPVPVAGAGKARILITGSLTQGEARSGCEILQMIVQRQLQQEVALVYDQDVDSLQDMLDQSFYLAVVLSAGVLQDVSFASLLLKIYQVDDRPEFVTVNLDNSFTFPTSDFYTETARNGMPGLEFAGDEDAGAALSKAYKSLLGILALPFSALGSQGLQEKQVHEIGRRFKRYAKAKNDDIAEQDESIASAKRQKTQLRLGQVSSSVQKSGEIKDGGADPAVDMSNESVESVEPTGDMRDENVEPAGEAAPAFQIIPASGLPKEPELINSELFSV